MKHMRPLNLAALAAALSVPAYPFANDPAVPVVVDLFTSPGCYSCPPAEKLLGNFYKLKTVLDLQFHVDFWDDLVYGAAGKWKDPFSKPAYAQRQSGYNMEKVSPYGGVKQQAPVQVLSPDSSHSAAVFTEPRNFGITSCENSRMEFSASSMGIRCGMT